MRINPVKVSLCLAMIAGALVITACAITGPGGGEYRIRPWLGTDVPAGGDQIGQFTDPETGRTYKLYDMNGDGKPDFAEDEDGHSYHVAPAPENSTALNPTLLSLGAGSLQGVGGVGPGQRRVVGKLHGHPDDPDVVLYINDPDTLMPVTFDQTAAEYLASTGLANLVPGQVTLLGSGFHLNGFEVVDLAANEFDLDVTMEWSGHVSMPSMFDHPDLQYEFYALSDSPTGFGEYLNLRVVGSDVAVARWMADLGVEEMSFNVEILGVSSNVYFMVDPRADSASLFIDGVLTKSTTLSP